MVYGGDMGFDDACEGALIGDGEGVVVEVAGAFHQFVGMGGTAEKGEVANAVEFGVGHCWVQILYG